MKSLTLSALFVGAALVATPALAQNSSTASQNVAANMPSSQPAADSAATNTPSGNASQSANTQTAMNGNGNNSLSAGSSVSGSISAIPNTEKKYRRANRSADFSTEEATTKELNQAAANATTQ